MWQPKLANTEAQYINYSFMSEQFQCHQNDSPMHCKLNWKCYFHFGHRAKMWSMDYCITLWWEIFIRVLILVVLGYEKIFIHHLFYLAQYYFLISKNEIDAWYVLNIFSYYKKLIIKKYTYWECIFKDHYCLFFFFLLQYINDHHVQKEIRQSL